MTGRARVVVLCPIGVRTGGPEALHQLVDSLRRQGVQSFICQPEGERRMPVPEYSHYKAPTIEWGDIRDGDVIVLPEKWRHLLPSLREHRVVLWWLSVNNAFRFSRETALRGVARQARQVLSHPERAIGLRYLDRRFPHIVHAAQSHYAFAFLERRGLRPRMLTDYIGSAGARSEGLIPRSYGRDVNIAYNPRKGAQTVALLPRAWREDLFTPIEGLDRAGVTDLLGRSRMYLDLGSHPGKDRLPREAALARALVVVADVGSAANNIDVPLPAAHKMKLPRSSRQVAGLVTALEALLADANHQRDRQGHYRAEIGGQRRQFDLEVGHLIAELLD